MKKCLIVGGADIRNYNRISEGLKRHGDEYFTIICDSGLKHMEKLGLIPNLIVGDFDSHENPELPVETIVLPTVKDDTDTVHAVKEAVERGFIDFVLIGAVGGRFDHSLGNISILTWLEDKGLKGVILDDYSELEMISSRDYSTEANGETGGESADDTAEDSKRRCYKVPGCYRFFSLVNITGTAKGVTIRNAKYNLEKAEITCEYAYGVSNEPLPGMTAEITIDDGKLLVIKDWE